MAVERLRQLKAPSRIQDSVEHLVRNHMRFGHVDRMRESTLRRMVGHPLFPLELELHRLDCACSHGDLKQVRFLREVLDRLKAEPVLPAPWIRGEDLLAMGCAEGPGIGRWLRAVYDRQLEHPEASREDLLDWLRAERARKPDFPSGTEPAIVAPHEPDAGHRTDLQ
jgi:poly(A) polymerase